MYVRNPKNQLVRLHSTNHPYYTGTIEGPLLHRAVTA